MIKESQCNVKFFMHITKVLAYSYFCRQNEAEPSVLLVYISFKRISTRVFRNVFVFRTSSGRVIISFQRRDRVNTDSFRIQRSMVAPLISSIDYDVSRIMATNACGTNSRFGLCHSLLKKYCFIFLETSF